MSGYPVRIAVRVDFSDGSQHDYEVRGQDVVPAPGGFWPEGVVTSDVAQRIDYARKRAAEIEKLRAERDQSRQLLEAALHLCVNGERAPGGEETWRDWERETEAFLRSRLPEPEAGPRHEWNRSEAEAIRRTWAANARFAADHAPDVLLYPCDRPRRARRGDAGSRPSRHPP